MMYNQPIEFSHESSHGLFKIQPSTIATFTKTAGIIISVD